MELCPPQIAFLSPRRPPAGAGNLGLESGTGHAMKVVGNSSQAPLVLGVWPNAVRQRPYTVLK
eukprot:scaffold996_cov409-Prasinococcus_capsulatus_cf.AAC.6